MSDPTKSPIAANNLTAERAEPTAEPTAEPEDGSSATTLTSQNQNTAIDAEKGANCDVTAQDNEPPDGGLAAWSVVFGIWCTSFCSMGWLTSIGVFQYYYQNVLFSDKSPSVISWISSLQIFFTFAMGPFVGAIYDEYGPRWLLFMGSILQILGIMMTSISTEYYQILLAQGVCSGIGMAAIFQPALNCIRGWFSHKQGAAIGILFTGSGIGGVIFPIMVWHLIREVGFGWAMRTSGFLMLFLLVIANLTVRPRIPPRPQRVTLAQFRKPFTESEFLIMAVGIFCLSCGFFVTLNYLPVQALSAGMDPHLIQYLLPILNATSLFGRLLGGFLCDKIGRYNVFIVMCYTSGLWILALWIPDTSDAANIAFAALFGFFSGAFNSLSLPLIMQISPIKETGFRTGIIMFVTAIGGLITNPINGAILESSGGSVDLKVFAGVFCIAGTTFVLVTRIQRTGWTLSAVF